jgi:5-methylthioadenosine/S-adenosylhomocysteine deaminase
MVLFRGQGEGLPLDRWLREVMWPREARLTDDDVEVAMTAASAELLRGGVTTSVEMYFSPERIAAAVGATGARAVIAAPMVPLPGMPPLEEQLAAGRRAGARRARRRQRRVRPGPHAAYTVPLPLLRRAAELAREHGMLLHLHVAETAGEGAGLLAEHGLSVPALLAAHDVLGGRVLAAHCVHLDDGDLELWAEYDVAVAHCPASNAKLASGVARCATCSTAASGWAWAPTGRRPTTGWTCSPTSAWPRSSPVLAGRDATALTAAEAFWLATGAAADAIGRPDLGQVTAGRRADLVHVDTRTSASSRWARPPTCSPTWSGRRLPAGARRVGGAGGRWSPTEPSRRWMPARCGPRSPSGRPGWPAEAAPPGSGDLVVGRPPPRWAVRGARRRGPRGPLRRRRRPRPPDHPPGSSRAQPIG